MASEKWDKKLSKIREIYPATNNINWGEILREEPDVFYSVIGGVTKTNKNSDKSNSTKVAQVTNSNYSELCFVESFKLLWGESSFRSMAHKTGIPSGTIQKYRSGAMAPSFQTMEKIAAGFNIDPSYFLEYRIGKILASIDSYLVENPEVASTWFHKIKKNTGLKIK